jgi:hypothetical protein
METLYVNKSGEVSLDLTEIIEKCPLIRFCETAKYSGLGDNPIIQECHNGNYSQCLKYQHGFDGRPTGGFKR